MASFLARHLEVNESCNLLHSNRNNGHKISFAIWQHFYSMIWESAKSKSKLKVSFHLKTVEET